MGKEETYVKYTPYEMSTIIERMNALNTITAAKAMEQERRCTQ